MGALPTFWAAVLVLLRVDTGQVGVQVRAVAGSQLRQQGPGSPGEGLLIFIYIWGGYSANFVGGLPLNCPFTEVLWMLLTASL